MQTFRAKPYQSRVLEFELAGDIYLFTTSKPSEFVLALLSTPTGANAELFQTKHALNWLSDGLNSQHDADNHEAKPDSNCQVCRLQGRLLDKNDKEVDLEIVMEVVNWLIGEVSGRPTS